MKKDSSILIQDILEAIGKIEGYVGDKSFEEFSADQMCHDATMRNLEVIGEASRSLPENFIENNPHLPVQNAVEMRNVLIHDYGQVDLAIVYRTVREDIPKLKQLLTDTKNH